MKVNLYWCPLCEKTRLEHREPTVWTCPECKTIFELIKMNYGEGKNDTMEMTWGWKLTDMIGENDDELKRRRNRNPEKESL